MTGRTSSISAAARGASRACANTVFTVVYRDDATGHPYIKRCKVEQYILSKGYSIVPENCTPLKLTTEKSADLMIDYKPLPRIRVLSETFKVADYLVKGVKAGGVRLATREVKSVRFVTQNGEQTELDMPQEKEEEKED